MNAEEAIETELRSRQVETAVLCFSDGTTLWGPEGTRDEAPIPKEWLRLPLARRQAATLCHNQPDGGAPSKEDFVVAAHLGVSHMRVVVPAGTWLVSEPLDGWSAQARLAESCRDDALGAVIKFLRAANVDLKGRIELLDREAACLVLRRHVQSSLFAERFRNARFIALPAANP